MSDWQTVIGLEVHVQLRTASKLFSGSATRYGAAPNTQASEVDIALPGVLPVMNREAARMAVKLGLAINARINRTSVFARKNYFYPDLPKGYQISQFEIPIVGNGHLDIEVDGRVRRIGITRAHLEEDAGKSLHEDFHGMTGVDLNRAGTPLVEVVSEPDLRSAGEAVAYLRKLHTLVRYLEICDGNMQEGSFRCDANVSVRRGEDAPLGTRSELKNINSFRFVEKAIEFEIERQIDILEGGGSVVQETRLYDPEKGITRPMRGKEEAHDYRYFPDPDLPPLVLDEDFVAAVRADLPELPDAKQARFESAYRLSAADAAALTGSREMADWFEAACVAATGAEPKMVANWLTVEVAGRLNRDGRELADAPVSAADLGGLVSRISDQTLSGKLAKEVFDA
ncbi:MAG: Asp-tRNA(Asn)/Glu-tRNA(Gln) amidotransferase subunit GatB, partial [Gammaproteobacteria bacterium]|nr:Asp-tRNA(Asn)/Glu-tRNA(Gln) amidotransferase subunit GatB [Gammaproteobacteria bacterium]